MGYSTTGVWALLWESFHKCIGGLFSNMFTLDIPVSLSIFLCLICSQSSFSWSTVIVFHHQEDQNVGNYLLFLL